MKEKIKVLVIDDDEGIRQALIQFLTRNNFEVHGASDATKALVKLWTVRYDVAITDVILPDVSGLRLLRMLLAMPIDTNFIVITGMDSPETRDEAFQLGANGYFTKPFDPEELLALMKQIVENRKLKGRS